MKTVLHAEMLVPGYLSEFRCIGGTCPDTCCGGWRISIDKDTFAHYQKVSNIHLSPQLQRHLHTDAPDTFALYGKLDLDPASNHCSLLNPENLCNVQLQLGESALSDTCFSYPRTTTLWNGTLEQCLSLSCPEAARLALTAPNAFRFEALPLTTRHSITTEFRHREGTDMATMDAVRAFVVQLLQTPELSIKECMCMLGWLSLQIDELLDKGAGGDIPALIETLFHMVESDRLHAIVQSLQTQPQLGVMVFYCLFSSGVIRQRSPQQQRVLDAVQRGLGLDAPQNPTDTTAIHANYLRGVGYLDTQGQQLEDVLRRYLLNELVREFFPWGHLRAMEHYRKLLSRLGILRLMFGATAAAQQAPLSEATLVETVQVFCRIYQHNGQFAQRAQTLLEEMHWETLPQLYTLLN